MAFQDITEGGIVVRATQQGWYGTFRNPGDVFRIANQKAFSKIWMERVEPEQPARAEKKSAAKAEAPAARNVI